MSVPVITNPAEYGQLSVMLAMEIASGMSKPSEIFMRHGLTPQQSIDLLKNPQFQSMLREAHSTWNSNANAEERIRLKSLIALEELLPEHFKLATDPDVSPASRIDAVKTFERLSGVAKTGDGPAAGSQFVVNINLGDKPEDKVILSGPALPLSEET